MTKRTAEEAVEIGETAERQPFLRSITSLGAVRRCVTSTERMAPMILEEASYYAEQKYRWTGLAAAGALLSEGLWVYQEQKRRAESERGPQL
jgi:hypothetical protein